MSQQQPIYYQSPPAYSRDADQLRLLAIFHCVWGGLVMLFSCLGIFHITVGVMMITRSPSMFPAGSGGAPPPAWFGWMFLLMGSFALLFGWTTGILNFYSARSMQKRRRRTFSLVTAGFNCVYMPLGTVLGIFTFIVLLRDSVRQTYLQNPANLTTR